MARCFELSFLKVDVEECRRLYLYCIHRKYFRRLDRVGIKFEVVLHKNRIRSGQNYQ